MASIQDPLQQGGTSSRTSHEGIRMTLIALEEHVLPADLVTQVWPTPVAPETLVATQRADTGEHRLRVMDEAGIDMQVLSVTAPGSQQVPADQAAPLSRALNDR